VEGELTPIAEELGLGVLPLGGPLKSGALTGKHTRASGAKPVLNFALGEHPKPASRDHLKTGQL
jgi:aryl-alcohol dehydrogenase-like predicted oxidoreductase